MTQRFFSFFFFCPLAFIGFDAQAVIAMVAFHLVLQLIPHTRVVPKLPVWIESWMYTPSHHLVHHAGNERYLDKTATRGMRRRSSKSCASGSCRPAGVLQALPSGRLEPG